MPELVREAAKTLGLTGPFPQLQYVRYMERAFRKKGARFLDAVDAWSADGGRPEGADALYQLLARMPPMAAYVSRHQFSQLYREAAERLAASGLLSGRVVVDFGCGFGLLTQLLARTHPDSRFVGFDHQEIVAAARKISAAQKLQNLSFVSDFDAIPSDSRNAAVLMVCVTHEIFPAVMSGAEITTSSNADVGRHLAALLQDGGILITINRFPYPERQLPRLDDAMAQFGLHVADSSLPAELLLEEAGMTSRLPIRAYGCVPLQSDGLSK